MKKLETKSTVLLKHHLKALRLPTIHTECEKVAHRCASEDVDHLGFLLQLCELELLERERRSAQRRLKAAKFPTPKTLESFDFAAAPKVNKPLILELLRCEYIDRRENVLFLGGSGSGKRIWPRRWEWKPARAASGFGSSGSPSWPRSFWRRGKSATCRV